MHPSRAVSAASQSRWSPLNTFGGDYAKALAAYNWGPGNVQRKGMASAPAETRNYIQKITGGDSLAMGPTPPPEAAGPPPPPAPAAAPEASAPPPMPAPA